MDPLTAVAATPDLTLTSYLIPVSAVAQWPAPNLIDPASKTWLIPLAIALEGLATIALATRLWARLSRYAGGFGADDSLMIGAWVFGTAYTVLIVYSIHATGIGKHIWDQDPEVAATRGLLSLLAQVFFLVSTTATKVSILLFYCRLLDRAANRYLLYAAYGGMAFAIAVLIGILVFLATYCTPTFASWQSLDLRYATDFQVRILSAVGDIYAIIIPEIVVARLKLPRGRKIVLYAIFGAGAVVVVAASVRTAYFIRFHVDPLQDLTWTSYDVFVWSTIELQFALLYACIPALKSVVANHPSRKSTGTANISAAGSFRKQRVSHVEDMQLSARKSAKVLPKQIRQRSSKDGIVVTWTFDLVSSRSPTTSVELGEPRVVVEHSFLNLDSP